MLGERINGNKRLNGAAECHNDRCDAHYPASALVIKYINHCEYGLGAHGIINGNEYEGST